MKEQRFYSFLIRKDGKFFEQQSYRDYYESGARQQAENYAWKLEKIQGGNYTVVRCNSKNY